MIQGTSPLQSHAVIVRNDIEKEHFMYRIKFEANYVRFCTNSFQKCVKIQFLQLL